MHNWETSRSRFIHIVFLGLIMAFHLTQEVAFSEWNVIPWG